MMTILPSNPSLDDEFDDDPPPPIPPKLFLDDEDSLPLIPQKQFFDDFLPPMKPSKTRGPQQIGRDHPYQMQTIWVLLHIWGGKL